MDGGLAYEKNVSDEVTKLQRLYGGGDLTKFPDFKFPGQFGLSWTLNIRICRKHPGQKLMS